jgi:hypothetical protein
MFSPLDGHVQIKNGQKQKHNNTAKSDFFGQRQ